MLLFSLFWVLFFEFMFFFSIFLIVPSTVCNYLSYLVWGGFWNLYGSIFLLVSFGCVFVDISSVDISSLTAFIGGQFSWSSHQESINPQHYLLYFMFSYSVFFCDFRNFLFGLPSPICICFYKKKTFQIKKKKKIKITKIAWPIRSRVERDTQGK